MYTPSRLAGILVCAATLAVVGCSANSGVTPFGGTTTQQSQSHVVPFSGPGWIEKNGVLYHTPHYMATRYTASKNHIQPDLLLQYFNGPVLFKPHMYLILWGFGTIGDPSGVGPLLKHYSRAVGGTGWANIVTQYYGKQGSQNVNIKNERTQFAGAWVDDTNAVPNAPSDAQVTAEALAGVAWFGYDPNGSYVVATPHGHNTPGFGTSFCAYHGNTTYQGQLVSYTNLPYMPDAGGNCGAGIIPPPSDESSADEGVTIVEGHEYAESVTDPIPGAGWYNSQGGEIGDLCAWQNIQNDPYHKKSYSAQPLFSNASQSCVHTYP